MGSRIKEWRNNTYDVIEIYNGEEVFNGTYVGKELIEYLTANYGLSVIKDLLTNIENCFKVIGDCYTVSISKKKTVEIVLNSFDNDPLFQKLIEHVGHDVVIVTYGEPGVPVNVSIECEDCGIVLVSADK